MAPASAAAAAASSSSSSLLLFSSLSSPNRRLLKSPISSLPIPSNSFISSPPSSSCRSSSIKTTTRPTNSSQHSISSSSSPASTSPLEALIFDCDGVILESENLHRTAYNDAFAHFDVRCPPSSSQPLLWDPDFYDVLQNQIGGGKPKMRWYFGENGWPSSKVFGTPPAADADREKLIDTIQVKPRPGVLRLMDEAKAAGIKLAVCSAATKSSVILCLENLIGLERFHGLDCFLAGDDVKEKKPDPSIYLTASKKLGVLGKNCLVVEDSVIGLQAATKAGMSCLVTYTSSTANQDFKDAITIYPDLSNVRYTRYLLI
ncbi:hypothetical protein MRB53_015307 [Persea americana]|uniref:Uncharacterized protein n=1 Tax=Persea americana TaxID=3435 RepID=A0ACC2KDE5_PERAE|nr:hypothetical protein MRB53_015307 [Persea americana]